jgi:phosphoserine phosphatase RsbU/P
VSGPPPGAGTARPGPTGHILIVDDLEINRDLLARRVRRLGHTTGFAGNGRDALAMLRRSPFDLVLLDITMPEMDGYEALGRIKADPRLAEIPVVMVTAIDTSDSVVRCLELGADDTITKPFNPVVLRARIESSLSRKRAADLQARLVQALSREMAIAQRIQHGFLPDAVPRLPGWPLAARCIAARQVGGDFFDVLRLDDGRLAFTVADVCDKGVGAALYMTLFRTLLRIHLQLATPACPAGALLQQAAAFASDYVATVHARDHMFATAFMAIVDPATGLMDYVNAGHDAAMLLRRDSRGPELLSTAGAALGLLAGQRHEARQTRLMPGDRLLAFTDGLPEARDPLGREFGSDRVAAVLARPMDSPETLLSVLHAELAQHVDGRDAHDDVTLLCLFARPGA